MNISARDKKEESIRQHPKQLALIFQGGGALGAYEEVFTEYYMIRFTRILRAALEMRIF